MNIFSKLPYLALCTRLRSQGLNVATDPANPPAHGTREALILGCNPERARAGPRSSVMHVRRPASDADNR